MPDDLWIKVAIPEVTGPRPEKFRAFILQRSNYYLETYGAGHSNAFDVINDTAWVDSPGVYHITFDMDVGRVRNVQATKLWTLDAKSEDNDNSSSSKPTAIVDDIKGIRAAMKKLGLR